MQRLLVRLDYAEGGCGLSFVYSIKPRLEGFAEVHAFRHKLEVLEATLGDDELDILDLSRGGVTCELSYRCDALVLEPFLQIRVNPKACARLPQPLRGLSTVWSPSAFQTV